MIFSDYSQPNRGKIGNSSLIITAATPQFVFYGAARLVI